jgi:hypothetical protein
MIDIMYKDIDPDTGKVTDGARVATCYDRISARWVINSLRMSILEAGEPNREIYSVPDLEDWPIH